MCPYEKSLETYLMILIYKNAHTKNVWITFNDPINKKAHIK